MHNILASHSPSITWRSQNRPHEDSFPPASLPKGNDNSSVSEKKNDGLIGGEPS